MPETGGAGGAGGAGGEPGGLGGPGARGIDDALAQDVAARGLDSIAGAVALDRLDVAATPEARAVFEEMKQKLDFNPRADLEG